MKAKNNLIYQSLFLILSIIVLSLSFNQTSLASNGGFVDSKVSAKGGFSGPGPDVSTVEEAKAMHHDSFVVLQGFITKSLGNEKYTFKDNSGTIQIEIDDDDWRGLVVSPEDKIEIEGEVEKKRGKIEIDVDRIKKI